MAMAVEAGVEKYCLKMQDDINAAGSLRYNIARGSR